MPPRAHGHHGLEQPAAASQIGVGFTWTWAVGICIARQAGAQTE